MRAVRPCSLGRREMLLWLVAVLLAVLRDAISAGIRRVSTRAKDDDECAEFFPVLFEHEADYASAGAEECRGDVKEQAESSLNLVQKVIERGDPLNCANTHGGFRRALSSALHRRGLYDFKEDIYKALVFAGFIEGEFMKTFGRPCRKLFKDDNFFWAEIGKRLHPGLAVSSVDGNPFPDKCAFWSGGIDVSLYARQLGYVTLEQTEAGSAFDAMNLEWGNGKVLTADWGLRWEQIAPIWNVLSKGYAKQCRGEVTVFMRAIAPDSVLYRQEYPMLKAMTDTVIAARERRKPVRLTYRLVLGNTGDTTNGGGEDEDGFSKIYFPDLPDSSDLKAKDVLLISGDLSQKDIDAIRRQPDLFRKVMHCNSNQVCDPNNEDQTRDIDIAYSVLWHHYKRMNGFCRIYYKSDFLVGGKQTMIRHEKSGEKATIGTATPTMVTHDENGEVASLRDWVQRDAANNPRPFWRLTRLSQRATPSWGFDICRASGRGENTVVAGDCSSVGRASNRLMRKWAHFCLAFLEDRWGVDPNLMTSTCKDNVLRRIKDIQELNREARNKVLVPDILEDMPVFLH